MKILVIDDDEIARELLVSTLELAGHQVFELPSAIGATRVIYAEHVDAVVVDVMLPDISGDKLARVLRQNAKGRQLAIVLVSSQPTDELQLLADSVKADAVVTKREVRSRLSSAVARAHEARRRPAPPRPA
jgi:two-component system phosphate regulon response regulator OmpR